MKKLIIFLFVVLYADISDILIKIKDIENMQKNFLTINYNIFAENYNTEPSFIPAVNNGIELKIFAIFNNKVNINGKWYKTGDKIESYKIFKITPDKVFLKENNKIIILNIKQLNILKVKE